MNATVRAHCPGARIAVSAASFPKNPTLVRELEQLSVPVKLNTTGRVFKHDELVAFLGDSTIAIVGTEIIDDTVLAACPNLKYIAKYGVGLDNLDIPLLERHGIPVGWTGGVNKRSVTELVLAFAIGHFHRVNAAICEMRRGEWNKNGGFQLTNLTVGIVGLGHVGSDLASVLKVFGPRLIYTDIIDRSSIAQALGLEPVSYAELLKQSDLISFHVPQTHLTASLFNAAAIATVKKRALIVNTSRGHVVDVAATCHAVVEGRLGGFAADVFPEEPAHMHQWATCDRLYFTPHIGGNTEEAVLAMGRSAIAHVQDYIEGCAAAAEYLIKGAQT